MQIISLNGAYRSKCIFSDGKSFEYEGHVPGSTVNDLVNAGKLPKDIFWRDNIDAVEGFELCDYVYERVFQFTGAMEGAILRFERLDTYCDVYLNGKLVGHTENGNVRHEFSVEGALKEGVNVLTVKLYSPIKAVEGKPKRSGAFTTERLHTRRMQCTYGWDWVARIISCSIRDCSLLIPDKDELTVNDVYIATLDTDPECASVRADINFKGAYRGRVITVKVTDDSGNTAYKIQRFCKESLVRVDMDIPKPRLWYPIGYGEQPLYTFTVLDGDNVIYTEKFGIRTVKIMQLRDEKGSEYYEKCRSVKNENYDKNDEFLGFILKVNGVKISCKGANWVPCVPFETEGVAQKQTAILELAAEMGVNMIRIWGGGAFESPHFYNECSRLGITVTQDFLMACGNYPENEDWFIDELRKEAEYASLLIRNQPCLMWWSGDNENAVNGTDTDEDYTGRRSAYEGIAPVLYKNDPFRRFLPSSPYGGNKYASNTVGTTHNTQYLGDQIFPYLIGADMSDYKDEFKKFRARFIAEEAQGGAVNLTTLKEFLTDDDIFGDDFGMFAHHTKGNPALKTELINYMLAFAENVLGSFKDGEDRLFKYRYSQYEWIRVLFEQARREKGFCNGIIFWMLNDCWPASSGWSLIDYYVRPKNALYSFKRCAQRVMTSVDRENGEYRVYIVNDGLTDEEVSLKVKTVGADGMTVSTVTDAQFLSRAESSSVAFSFKADLSDGEVIIADISGDFGHDRTYYKDGALRIRKTSVSSFVDTEKCTVTVRSDSYVQAVMLDGYAVFEDNCFTLLPNEERTVTYRIENGKNTPKITVEAYTLEA